MKNSVEKAQMTAVNKKAWNRSRILFFFSSSSFLFPSKENFHWCSQEMWFWTRTANVSWLPLDWTFPQCFSHEAAVGLTLRAHIKWPRLWMLKELKKKILADTILFNLLSFPVAIFCSKKRGGWGWLKMRRMWVYFNLKRTVWISNPICLIFF